MSPRPAIFISAVSSELKSARQLVANTLTFLGYDPEWQDIFGTEEGDLRAMRAAVQDVLEVRFPGAVPREVTEAIRQETKLPLLQHGLRVAVTVKSPDEVRTFLQQGELRLADLRAD